MENNHSIGLTGIQNARELGGYKTADGRTVKSGVLLRTAKLSAASEDDLRRLTEVYRLAKIFDLRSPEEIEGSPDIAPFQGTSGPDPDPVPGDAEYFNLPVLNMKKMLEQNYEIIEREGISLSQKIDPIQMITVSINAGMIGDGLYYGFLDDEPGRQSYSRMFRELLSLEDGRSALFHCTQGKDRTGVAAMLILSALGVPEKTIIEDYLLTNVFNEKRIGQERMMLQRSGKVPPEMIDTYLMAMDRVNGDTMTSVFSHIKEKYGSVTDYLINELGVSEAELGQLKKKFLTE